MLCPRSLFLRWLFGAVITPIVACLFLATTLDAAWPQDKRTLKIIVPFSSGGGADVLARLLAEQIGRARDATIIVENRPGAGTAIATEAMARAEPDGTTVLIVANSFLIKPALRKRNYDPLASFEALCLLTRSPNVVGVHSASPYRTLTDLVEAARAKPGEVTMAFNGPATSQQIGYEKLKRATKIDMIPVTFPGGAPAVNALLGQHVASLFVNYPSASELIAAGNLRAGHNLAQAQRAASRRSDGRRTWIPGFRRGRMVWCGGSGKDTRPSGGSAGKLVPCSPGR
jgi:tripartite-type tricarboxylate transporter receptor subunit TctC